MKKTLYVALAAAAMALGASGAASAAVPASAGHSARAGVAPLQLIDNVDWHGRRRICEWRHHRRICWWRHW